MGFSQTCKSIRKTSSEVEAGLRNRALYAISQLKKRPRWSRSICPISLKVTTPENAKGFH